MPPRDNLSSPIVSIWVNMSIGNVKYRINNSICDAFKPILACLSATPNNIRAGTIATLMRSSKLIPH